MIIAWCRQKSRFTLFLWCKKRQNHHIKAIVLSNVTRTKRNKLQYLYLLIIIHNGIIMEQTTPLNGTIIRDPAWKKKKGLGPWIMVTALLLGLGLAFYAGQRSGSTSRTGPGGTTRVRATTASLTMSSNEAVFESSMLTTTNKNTKPLAASRIVPPRKK